MSTKIPGIIHVHSKYSHDGTMSLGGIRALCKEKGCNFVAVTEHAESMDENKMTGFLSECKTCSDSEFVMIPGLEYNSEGMHILAIGITELLDGIKPEKLIDTIHARGGLSLLAHVVYYDTILYEKLKGLDGIEIWNPRYSSKFSPSLKALRILKRFRKNKKNIMAFSGLDLHEKRNYGDIITLVDADGTSSEDIINSLREGRFQSIGRLIRFDAQKDPRPISLLAIYPLCLFYWSMETTINLVKALNRKTKIKPPENIIKRFRRILR